MRSAITRNPKYKWWIFAAIGVGVTTMVADLGAVSVALPTISDHFDADLPTAQWVMVGYALALSALLMPMGRLSDIVGLKQVYVAGLLIFAVAAVLAFISSSILALILARVLMGVGAAMAQGTSMAILARAFPSSERGTAMGGLVGMVGLGAIIGPPLAGLLVSTLDWRWVFFAEIPAAFLAVAVTLVVLDGRHFRRDSSQRPDFDWLGAALSVGALVSFMLALTNGPRIGWSSPLIGVAVVAAAALLSTFVWWELRSPTPMLDLRLFRRRLFTIGIVSAFLSFVAAVPSFFLMPFYLQVVMGLRPSEIGLIILPNAMAMTVLGVLSGLLSDRYGRRVFMVGGQLMTASGCFILAGLTVNSHLGIAVAGMFLIRCGSGTFESPNASSVLSTIEQERYGVVSGFLNLIRNGSNVISVAMVTAIITGTMAAMGYVPSLAAVTESGVSEGLLMAFTTGLRRAFLVLGLVVLCGTVVLFVEGWLPRRRAAPYAADTPSKHASEDRTH